MKKLCFLSRYSLIAVMKDRIYLVNSWPFLVRYGNLFVSSSFNIALYMYINVVSSIIYIVNLHS